ncbi:SH3 DOMAIN BINDING GLUTAMIC ACID-RICH PROTEIN LIKE 3 [Ceraceosorus bombacis]|uniref:SH3 DOMAIN BINDING GLUTAMIC ACID-RICH PROTEIN LIKE 3 n=1 Tax=Ceraceosorus bombacis TaxID=401625 RepID=A0A0P1BGN6_9BASI|nr:SH3 DOMAIN BINDING GLUTAMIC ACID-RICH PROTEIN LIKE 3 [Ceraceosorus bombacis]
MATSVELFSTSILSNIKVRSRHERFVSVLTVKKVPYIYHDLASDEDAKSRWRRKARDPQIPGLLVNNEWRGTFEEFEEAVEFGELDLFLRVDDGRTSAQAPASADAPSAATGEGANGETSRASTITEGSSNEESKPPATGKHLAPIGLAKPRSVSDRGPVAAPTVALPHAPTGAGKREQASVEDLMESFDANSLDLNDDDVDAMLAEISALSLSDSKRREEEKAKAKALAAAESQDHRKRGLYPQLGITRQAPVPRTYIPSANAGVAPLKLAKMGTGSASAVSSRSMSESSSSASDSSASRLARYNASQMSSKALVAEASSAATARGASSSAIAKMIAEGGSLSEALTASRSDAIVGHEDADALLASLGLADIQLTPDEAEAFISHGTIPEGASSGGARLKRVQSKAERARDEVGAREVARRARERGAGGSVSSISSFNSSENARQRSKSPLVSAETELPVPVSAHDDAANDADLLTGAKPSAEEPKSSKKDDTTIIPENAIVTSPFDKDAKVDKDTPTASEDHRLVLPPSKEEVCVSSGQDIAAEATQELELDSKPADTPDSSVIDSNVGDGDPAGSASDVLPIQTSTSPHLKPRSESASEPAAPFSNPPVEPDETPRAKQAELPDVDDVPAANQPPPNTDDAEEAEAAVAELPVRSIQDFDKRTSRPMSKFVGGAETDAAIALMLHEGEVHRNTEVDGADGSKVEGANGSAADGKPLPPTLDLSGISNDPQEPGASPSTLGASAKQLHSPHGSPEVVKEEARGSENPSGADSSQSANHAATSPPSRPRPSRSSTNMKSPPASASSRRAIDVQRRDGSSSSPMTPSHSGPSLSSSPPPPSPHSASSRHSSSGPDSSLSHAHSSGSISASGPPKKGRFSLAKFGKGKNEKVTSPLSPSSSGSGKDSFFGSVGRSKSSISDERKSSSTVSREDRMHKTLSQILRDADAAMADLDNDNDAASIMSKDDGLSWEGDDDDDDDGGPRDFDVKIPA